MTIGQRDNHNYCRWARNHRQHVESHLVPSVAKSEVEKRLSAKIENLVVGEFPEIESLPKFTYTRLVIDEALRLYPPGWLMTRSRAEG
jgi:hypothetical protein